MQGGGVFLKGLQKDTFGHGVTVLNNCIIADNTANFGGGLACSTCRAVLSNVTLEGNKALQPVSLELTMTAKSSTEKPRASIGQSSNNSSSNDNSSSSSNTSSSSSSSSNNSNSSESTEKSKGDRSAADVSGHERGVLMPYIISGVGGGIAANLAGSSFILLNGASTLDNNKAGQLGGGIYLNSSKNSCDREYVPVGLGDRVVPCGVFLDAGVEVGGGNYAPLRGALLAWTGQAAFKWCCGSSAGSGVGSGGRDQQQQCFNATEPPNCPGSPLMNVKPALLYGTLPTTMVAFNNSCLKEQMPQNLSAVLDAAAAAGNQDDPGTAPPALIFAGQSPPEWTLNCSMTGQAIRPQLYSGGVLNMTVVVLDGYGNVMNMGPSYLVADHALQDASSARADVSSGTTAGSSTDAGSNTGVIAAAWAVAEDEPQVLVRQSDMGLFVIGELKAELDVTAQFTNLSLQPVQPPRENKVHNFTIVPTKDSDILRQVGPWVSSMHVCSCRLSRLPIYFNCRD